MEGAGALQPCFEKLKQLEDAGVASITIEDGVMRYAGNMPTLDEKIAAVARWFTQDRDTVTYSVPHIGDLVLGIRVSGDFASASVYQYDWAGSRKVCYDACEATNNVAVLEPFPDGYPLLPSVKALYVDVSGTGRVEVVVTYAFLDAASRRLLSGFTDGDEDKGVKVRHRDGTMYQVVGLLSPGHSPNYLAPLSRG